MRYRGFAEPRAPANPAIASHSISCVLVAGSLSLVVRLHHTTPQHIHTMSKCPKCSNIVTTATLNDVSIGKWRGVSYSCPFCFSILSIAIDPVALKSDAIGGVADELKPVREQLARLEHAVSQIGHLLDQK